MRAWLDIQSTSLFARTTLKHVLNKHWLPASLWSPNLNFIVKRFIQVSTKLMLKGCKTTNRFQIKLKPYFLRFCFVFVFL